MYACLHIPAADACKEELLHLALEFSPAVERTANDTVVFSIDPLRRLIGSPHQIASEICRLGYERNLKSNLAIASNPDTAILLGRNFAGVILVTPGEEGFKLGSLPLTCLFMHDASVNPDLLDVLNRWGLKTCEDLAVLPESGITERLGQAGIYLRNLACGRINRPLRVSTPETNYEERMDLDHSISLLEPILFLLGRVLSELCGRLRSQSRAARAVEARFELEGAKEYRCELEFPVPLLESPTMLKLLQLHLERHLPNGPIIAFTLRVEPAGLRRVQHGMFLPPTPDADKLHVTLARIERMVGKENVGTAVLLNTHRPDAFQMSALNSSSIQNNQNTISIKAQTEQPQMLQLAIRLFRPALQANVKLAGITPKTVVAPGVKGKVIQSAGPWKISGEWWMPTSWEHEEWDVALDDGALYQVYRESKNHEWYVHGIYD
jgi:protein ImuB